ncbi:hypothetical protein JHK82_052011 [Glycine max]|nr:hypothetical protein JHK86_051846 [Glycine max]KAG5093233.1 hypothetical protein JHK82_052011 [Glycine max]KAG5096301.1 hypothetical protein JHK84_051889 [Glycine max]
MPDLSFQVRDLVESRCFQGGCRGAWFRCKVCFICKKKKQFWYVRCKVAFHSKYAAWSDSVLQLKDHPGHTVCWRHPYDWHLDRKVNFFFSP